MRKWVFWIMLVLVIGGLIVWKFQQKAAKEAGGPGGPGGGRPAAGQRGPGGPGGPGGRGPVSVETGTVTLRDIVKTFTATGSVESMQSVKISPKVSGRIELLQLREGDRVRRGQVLVRIDQSQVQADVRQQQANVAEANYRLAQAQLNQEPADAAIVNQIRQQEAALAQAKSRLEQAKITQSSTDTGVQTQIRQQEANLASMQADLKQTESSRAAQVEATRSAIDEAQAKIDNAAAGLSNANAAVKSAQANLDNAVTKYNRTYELYTQGFVAAQDVDDARTTMRVQQAALDSSKGQVQAATASLGSMQAQKRTVESQAVVTRTRLDADLEAAKAKVAQAQAALDNARANTAQTPAYQQNLETLRAQVVQAQAALDSARANRKQSAAYQQNLAALRAGIAVAQASLDSARARLADTVLISPLDGVVTARTQDPGAMASPGLAILTIQSLNQVWITLAVPDTVCLNLRLNDPATVAFDALGGKALSGRIAQINPSADPASRQFTVRVMLDNASGRFSPGLFARVTLTVDRALQVTAVPPEAVETGRDGGAYVLVVGKDMTAKEVPVVAGLTDNDWVAITGNVHAGDKVVAMSATPVHDGQAVRAGSGRNRRGGRPGSGGQPDKRRPGGDTERIGPSGARNGDHPDAGGTRPSGDAPARRTDSPGGAMRPNEGEQPNDPGIRPAGSRRRDGASGRGQ